MNILKKSIANSLAILTFLGGISLPARATGEDTLCKNISEGNYNDVQQWLIGHGRAISCDLNYQHTDGHTPLTLAVEHELPFIVRNLLLFGFDPNTKNKSDITPLALAVSKGNAVIVDIILGSGKITGKDDINNALTLASQQGNYNVLGVLLSHCRDFGEQAMKTALNAALEAGNVVIAIDLLRNGATTDIETMNKALLSAVRNGNTAFAQELLAHGAQADCRDADGKALLTIAVDAGNLDILNLLMNHGKGKIGADVMNHALNQAVLAACSMVRTERETLYANITNALLENGANPSAPCFDNTWSNSLLNIAVQNESQRVVGILLESKKISDLARGYALSFATSLEMRSRLLQK